MEMLKHQFNLKQLWAVFMLADSWKKYKNNIKLYMMNSGIQSVCLDPEEKGGFLSPFALFPKLLSTQTNNLPLLGQTGDPKNFF